MKSKKRKPIEEIGNIPHNRFYQVKKLCTKSDKLQAIIEALRDYDDFTSGGWVFRTNSEKLLAPKQDIEAQIKSYEEESEQNYWEIQKLLNNKNF